MSVSRPASRSARNKQGNTALHYCFGYGYYELGEYLIDKGADDRVVNAAGETPYDGLSADQRGPRSALRSAGAARDAKRLHRDDDRRLARTIDAHGGYSDTESIVALTDDDDRDHPPVSFPRVHRVAENHKNVLFGPIDTSRREQCSRSSRSLRKALTGIRAFPRAFPTSWCARDDDGDARETSSARREGWRRLIRRCAIPTR